MQGQGQKYGQKHETKELVEFYNHLHALTMDLGGGFHCASQKTREHFYFILTGQLCIDQSQSSSANHKLITVAACLLPTTHT